VYDDKGSSINSKEKCAKSPTIVITKPPEDIKNESSED